MTSPTTSDAIAEADRFDASGNHDEAVNVLARATQQGDLAAKTRLGKRMLVGDRCPYLPRDGASFILEAAQAGNAEAVSMVAVFQATGITQQKNWSHALNTLTHAATLGSPSAREQLVLLAGTGEPAISPDLLDIDDAQHWRQLRESIYPEDWLAPVAGRVLNEEPLIKTFEHLLSEEICRWLMRLSAQRLKRAMVYDATNRRNYASETRTNSIAEFNLVENELLHFLIQQKMSSACNVPMAQFEGTAILNYQPGEEISPHFDFVDPKMRNYDQEIAKNGQRIITFLIYLNEEYEAGDTIFTELNLSFKGKTGDGIFFTNSLPDGSSDMRTRHSGTPPASGEKWILSQFIRNREVKYILD